jgi:hypothetical protein
MSAVTPLPSDPPAAPVPVLSRRSPFVHLVTDPWILISWMILAGTGMISVLLLLLQPPPPSIVKVLTFFLFTGYCFWALYFGLAACWRIAISMLGGTASMWIAIAVSMLPPGWILFCCALLYALFGGGIYQFARRWWLLAHGQRPSFLTTRRPVMVR